MYMSYCKYEGTGAELRRCLTDVDEHIDDEAEYTVSEKEIKEFRRMVVDFHEFLAYHSLILDDGELDCSKLDYICEKMRHGTEED